MKSLLIILLLILFVPSPVLAAEQVAVTFEQFLIASPIERIGYLKGVIDTLGITCKGLTYEQGLILSDTMVQRYRILALDRNYPEKEWPAAAVMVMVGLRSMGCHIPPLDKMDVNATVDEILKTMKSQGGRR